MSRILRPTDIVIAVVGSNGCGKSTFISKCTGQEVEVEHGLSSCTTLVEPFTFDRHGRTVHLIDTPGFDGTASTDALLLEDIAVCLNQAYLSGVKLDGIICLHAISTPRVQGATTKCLRIIEKICGPDAISLLLLGSTMWNREQFEVGERREEELVENNDFWGGIIDRGARTFRFFDDPESALVACDYIIQRGQKKTVALQHQMINERKPLGETDAGLELESDILQLKEFCKSRIEEARVEAEKAAEANNNQLALALSTTYEELHLQLDASTRAMEMIRGNMETLHARNETALREELRRLNNAEEQERLEHTERRTELDQLRRRLKELAEELESENTIELENIIELESIIESESKMESASTVWSESSTVLGRTTEKSDSPPPSYTFESDAGSLSTNDEVKVVLQKYAKCRKELEVCQKREVVRQHRKQTCENRLGIGAGVVSAVFQVAAFGLTAAACNIM